MSVEDLRDIIETIKSEALQEGKEDYLNPMKFYIDAELALELIENTVDFARQLQKDLLCLRRFASYSALRSEVYTELYYLRAYLHKFLLSLLYDTEKQKAYFYGSLKFKKLDFRLMKHKMLRELDFVIEYLNDYDAFRRILTPPEIDSDTIYIVWKEAEGLKTTLPDAEDVKLVYADSPEGTVLCDAFMIKKFPAVIFPAGGIVIQGVKKLHYALKTVRQSTKMDSMIESELFRSAKDDLQSQLRRTLDLVNKAFSGEWDPHEVLEIYRAVKRTMPIVKKILNVEMGGFAKANTDLFSPVAASCYLATSTVEMRLSVLGLPMTEKVIQDLYILALMLSEVLGIIDFLEQYKPADINPPFHYLIIVGHKYCPSCNKLKESFKELGLFGLSEDVKIEFVDAITEPERAAQFYQYVVPNEREPLQAMDSPIMYYALTAISPPLDAEAALLQISEEIYEKLKKKIRQAKAIEIVMGRSKSKKKGTATIEYEVEEGWKYGHSNGEVWEYRGKKLKLEDAVKILRELDFKWDQIQLIISLFYGKHYSDSTLSRIYYRMTKGEKGKEK